jgi:hypothetical protein
MPCMTFTELTFHFEMSELKFDALWNNRFMSVTSLTHQSPITPNWVRVVQVGVDSQLSLM